MIANRHSPEQRAPIIKHNAQDMRKWYPAWENMDWDDVGIIEAIYGEIEDYNERQKDWRIQNWQRRMDNCEKELIKWVKKSEEEMNVKIQAIKSERNPSE